MDTASLNGFCDVEIGIIIGNGSQDGTEPSISGLKKLYSELGLSEDIHTPQEANDTEAGRELDVGPQLLDELAQHQLHGLAHLTYNALATQG